MRCACWPSKLPVTRARWRCSTSSAGCWRTNSGARSICIVLYGGVVPELASRDHLRRLLPLLTHRAGAGADAAGRDRWYRLYGRSGPGRRIADRRGTGACAQLRLGACRRSACIISRATCWRPMLESPPPPLPACRAAGVGRTHHADRCAQHRRLPCPRTDARRCGRRGLRQDRQAARPAVSGRARAGAAGERGRPGVYTFPRPMLDRPGFEFSFSGLKTAVMQAVRARELTEQARADIAHAVQDAIVDHAVHAHAAGAALYRASGAGGGGRRRRQSRAARAAGARGAGRSARRFITRASNSVPTMPP